MTEFANNTNNSDIVLQSAFQHAPLYIYIYMTIINAVIFLVGVFGNTLVILVVCRVRSMRDPTNYFLLTLSVADLCVLLVCQPVAIMEFYAKERWYIGSFMCKYINYYLRVSMIKASQALAVVSVKCSKLIPLLENGSLHVSIVTMIAMTTERYYSITYPLQTLVHWKNRMTVKVIISIWIFGFLSTSPFLIITNLEGAEFYDGTPVQVCRTHIYLTWHKVFVIGANVAFFLVPFVVLTLMYSKIIKTLIADRGVIAHEQSSHTSACTRKQVIRTFLLIIILFFITMCPIRVFSLWQTFAPVEDIYRLGIESFYNITWFARIMMYINSAGNPIIYSLSSTKFKNGFRTVLLRRNTSYNSVQMRYMTRHLHFSTSANVDLNEHNGHRIPTIVCRRGKNGGQTLGNVSCGIKNV
ncbi:GPR54-like protein [Mya arenaria]|uniref:GPR54-like protein n=1 Tax=Mya arenaria TaxID=6604 RepID=A0ABY7FIL7_MYAAR|nr:GPR54-like protein [Mya arenaria]